jgi:hypothetical protein
LLIKGYQRIIYLLYSYDRVNQVHQDETLDTERELGNDPTEEDEETKINEIWYVIFHNISKLT